MKIKITATLLMFATVLGLLYLNIEFNLISKMTTYLGI